ncbi:MAG: hypothetical protein VB036_13585, partial [Propionicimonas sp.]|nr:hypothetical protein [Propionicimonas sp.]
MVTDLRIDGVRGRRFVATGRPRFGWRNEEDVRANRVLVARSEADLLARERLLWDSGWINPALAQVDYAGNPLAS